MSEWTGVPVCQFQIVSTEGFTPLSCAKTVPKFYLFSALGIALSEKQIPQVVEIIENRSERMEALEGVAVLRRQMPYPAELQTRRQ